MDGSLRNMMRKAEKEKKVRRTLYSATLSTAIPHLKRIEYRHTADLQTAHETKPVPLRNVDNEVYDSRRGANKI